MSEPERQIIRRIAALDPVVITGQCVYCFFCDNDMYRHGPDYQSPQHKPDCIYLLSRNLVKEFKDD